MKTVLAAKVILIVSALALHQGWIRIGDLPVVAANEKLIKKAQKEGGRLGMDLTGASEMGGTEYFVTSLNVAEGDYDALMAAKTALMEECTCVGVILVTAGVKVLNACCIVPADKAEVLPASEWLAAAFKSVGAEIKEGATATYAEGTIIPQEGTFTIKLKDSIQAAGVQVLREKGKLPEDSDSEDDICYGDDDMGNF